MAKAIPFAEVLDSRQHFSVSVNADGFTVVTPETDSKLVYVSSSTGSDSNTGLSPSSPVRSFSKANSLVRNGMPDQLLLKSGDVFYDTFGYWKKSGRDANAPMVIGSYGEGARPEIRTGTATGIYVGSIAAKQIDNLAIIGLRFRASGRDPSLGGTAFSSDADAITVISGTRNLLIEDCRVERYQMNIAVSPIYGDSFNMTLRRNIIIDAFSKSQHASGFFADGVRGLTVEGNTFDHNGWLEAAGAVPTLYNHNIYVTGNTSDVVVKDNIISNAASHGLQARSGGDVTGNLFLDNPIGMSYGLVNGSGVNKAGGVTGTVSGNVFLGGRDINGAGRGMAIEVSNVRQAVIRDNVISTGYAAGKLWAISLVAPDGVDKSRAVGIQDLLIENNTIYKWYKGLFLQYGMSPTAANSWQDLGSVAIRNNTWAEITSTIYINTASGFASILDPAERTLAQLRAALALNPDRGIADYAESIGLSASKSAWVDAARSRAVETWDPEITAESAVAYVRDGFGLDSILPL